MNFSVRVFFFKIFLIKFTYQISNGCLHSMSSLLTNCFHLSSQKLECTNFTSLNELNLTPCLTTYKPLYNYIRLKPNKPIIFDNQLDLRHLTFDSKRFQFILENFNGFEITFNPFLNSHDSASSQQRLHYLSISNSNFKFFYRNNTFDWICDLVMNADTSIKPLFSSYRVVYLGGTEQNDFITYTHSLCPVIFKDSRLDSLYFFNITLRNRPQFIQFEKNQSNLINSVIKNLHIQSSVVKLDNLFLDKIVFKSLEKLSIEFSYLVSIKTDLFAAFHHLKQINLWIFNMRSFLYATLDDNKWMSFINRENASEQVYIEFNDEKSEYDFPDKDFCLFKHFPHANRVFPILKNSNRKRNLNCTCTIVWLLKEWHHADKNIRTELISSCFRSKSSYFDFSSDKDFSQHFQSLIEKCNLNERVQKCFSHTYKKHSLKDYFLSSGRRNLLHFVLKPLFILFYLFIL
jgi:hypothetical protein